MRLRGVCVLDEGLEDEGYGLVDLWIVGEVVLEWGKGKFVLEDFLGEKGDAFLVGLELFSEGLLLAHLAQSAVADWLVLLLVIISLNLVIISLKPGILPFSPRILPIPLNNIRIKHNLLKHLQIILLLILNLKHQLKQLKIKRPINTVLTA